MDARLTSALAPVLHDLAVTGAPEPRVEESDWGAPDVQLTAMLYADGVGQGVSVHLAETPTESVVRVADAVQEFVVEVLWSHRRPTNWPRCPRHPESHPLRPTVKDAAAVWSCPADDVVVVEIGCLTT